MVTDNPLIWHKHSKKDELFLWNSDAAYEAEKDSRDSGSAHVNSSCQPKSILYRHPMFHRVIHQAINDTHINHQK